jgi:2-polyprenyl-3-methyl-5-hydroxy-6-metoxy-1,4-benzoquinol methylase
MNTARLLLANLRGGDYAHAGDREAIDIVLEKVLALSPKIQKGACLDVGSGLGGTANYIYNLGFHSIYGIDLDQAAIEYAKQCYQHIHCLAANANDVTKLFNEEFFSFIYMFNVLYAIEDKSFLLKNLYDVAKPGAILVLFDYTTEQISFSLKDLAGKPMHPIRLKELGKNLKDAGWKIIEIHDLSSHFLRWYRDLLDKIEKEQELLSSQFSEVDINKVKTTFNTIYEWLNTSQLGGAVIYARKPDSDTF